MAKYQKARELKVKRNEAYKLIHGKFSIIMFNADYWLCYLGSKIIYLWVYHKSYYFNFIKFIKIVNINDYIVKFYFI